MKRCNRRNFEPTRESQPRQTSHQWMENMDQVGLELLDTTIGSQVWKRHPYFRVHWQRQIWQRDYLYARIFVNVVGWCQKDRFNTPSLQVFKSETSYADNAINFRQKRLAKDRNAHSASFITTASLSATSNPECAVTLCDIVQSGQSGYSVNHLDAESRGSRLCARFSAQSSAPSHQRELGELNGLRWWFFQFCQWCSQGASRALMIP